MLIILLGILLVIFFLFALKHKIRLSLGMILFIGLVLRAIFIIVSFNFTNFDLESYRIIGELTLDKTNIYPAPAMIRYPYLPLMLYVEALSRFFGDYSSIFLKSIFSLFDLGVGYLIFKATKNKHLTLLYVINPVSIFTASVHGQFDAIPLFYLLASAILISKDRVRSLLAGLSLSLAITVKTWPLLFILAFVKKTRSFFFLLPIFLIPLLVILIYSLLYRSSPYEIFRVLKNYQPVYGVYGLSLLTKQVFRLESIADVARLIRIFLILFIGFNLFLKIKNIFKQIYYLMIFILTFTPVFGQQWLSWVIPFFLLAKEKDYGIYSAVVGIYMLTNFALWQGLVKEPFPIIMGVIVWVTIFFIFLKRIPSLLDQKLRHL